jgi:hypothetical protein
LQELHSNGEDKIHKQLKKLLDLPSVDILDESDELLKHKFQLVYAWGDRCDLPSFDQRVMMVQYVLQVLCMDSDVKDLLTRSCQSEQEPPDGVIETESMSLTPHPERIGSLPSIRLIPGASFKPQKVVPAARYFHHLPTAIKVVQSR